MSKFTIQLPQYDASGSSLDNSEIMKINTPYYKNIFIAVTQRVESKMPIGLSPKFFPRYTVRLNVTLTTNSNDNYYITKTIMYGETLIIPTPHDITFCMIIRLTKMRNAEDTQWVEALEVDMADNVHIVHLKHAGAEDAKE